MQAGNVSYTKAEDISDIVPVFPLTGALLLPSAQMPLNIFEPRYLEMVDDAIRGNKLIGIVQPCLKSTKSHTEPPKLSKIGCLGRIVAFQESGDGRYLINLAGICRYEIEDELDVNTGYRQCRIKCFKEDLDSMDDKAADIDRQSLLSAFKAYLDVNDMDADWDSIANTDTQTLLTALCMMSPFNPAEKQALLEANDLRSRCETLITISQMNIAKQKDDNSSTLQ